MFRKKPYLSDCPNRWFEFNPSFDSGFFLNKWGYFDERPLLGITITQIISFFLLFYSPIFLPLTLFGWGKLYLKLPIRTGVQECESPCWGFWISSEGIFWIYTGGNGIGPGSGECSRTSISIKMPWFLEWYRTSILLEDGSWETEMENDRKGFWRSDWDNRKWKMRITQNGSGLTGLAKVSEMEWRRKWLKHLPIFNYTRRWIEIDFDDKVQSKDLRCSFEIGGSEDFVGELERIGFTSKEIIRSRKIRQILSN